MFHIFYSSWCIPKILISPSPLTVYTFFIENANITLREIRDSVRTFIFLFLWKNVRLILESISYTINESVPIIYQPIRSLKLCSPMDCPLFLLLLIPVNFYFWLLTVLLFLFPLSLFNFIILPFFSFVFFPLLFCTWYCNVRLLSFVIRYFLFCVLDSM